MKPSYALVITKPPTQLVLPDAIPMMAMIDRHQASMFQLIGKLRGPFQGVAKWPTLEEVLAAKSKNFREQHGDEKWQQHGGCMDSRGQPSCELTSQLTVDAIAEVVDGCGGLLWTDKAGVVWAVRLCRAEGRGAGALYGFAIVWNGTGESTHAVPSKSRLSKAPDNPKQKGSKLRLTSRAEQMLWVIHTQVLAQRCSNIIVPDTFLGEVVWGGNHDQWPDDWRHDLFETLKSLMNLRSEVFRLSSTGWSPRLGASSVAISTVAKLWAFSNNENQCRPDCPYWDKGVKHDHFLIEVSSGFLGVLEQFGLPSSKSKLRTFNFVELPEDEAARKSIQDARKEGRIITVNVVAAMLGPARWAKLSVLQQRIIQALTREITRAKNSSRPDKAAIVQNGRVPGPQGKTMRICPYLQSHRCYVAFNGNGRRRGSGYTLFGAKGRGWLHKFGLMPEQNADAGEVRALFKELNFWQEAIGLVVVGYNPKRDKWLDWSDLKAMATGQSPQVNPMLISLHLRFYAPEDYLDRLRDYFVERGGFATNDEGASKSQSSLFDDDLPIRIRRNGIRYKDLASELGVAPSFVSQLMKGRRRWPQKRRDHVEKLLSEIEDKED